MIHVLIEKFKSRLKEEDQNVGKPVSGNYCNMFSFELIDRVTFLLSRISKISGNLYRIEDYEFEELFHKLTCVVPGCFKNTENAIYRIVGETVFEKIRVDACKLYREFAKNKELKQLKEMINFENKELSDLQWEIDWSIGKLNEFKNLELKYFNDYYLPLNSIPFLATLIECLELLITKDDKKAAELELKKKNLPYWQGNFIELTLQTYEKFKKFKIDLYLKMDFLKGNKVYVRELCKFLNLLYNKLHKFFNEYKDKDKNPVVVFIDLAQEIDEFYKNNILPDIVDRAILYQLIKHVENITADFLCSGEEDPKKYLDYFLKLYEEDFEEIDWQYAKDFMVEILIRVLEKYRPKDGAGAYLLLISRQNPEFLEKLLQEIEKSEKWLNEFEKKRDQKFEQYYNAIGKLYKLEKDPNNITLYRELISEWFTKEEIETLRELFNF